MNELIIDHPVATIEALLKMGKGDKGRLLYLKKAFIDGKIIYESDKKYLRQMQKDLSKNKSSSNNSKFIREDSKNDFNKKILSKQKGSNSNEILITGSGKIHNNDNFQEIQSIQTLIEDIKKKDSNIQDNLELLLINRKMPSSDTEKISFVDYSNESNGLLNITGSIIQRNSLQQFKFLGLKKHDLMAYAAAGLFSVWFAGFTNLINLGPMKGLTLGLSAGSAVAAGLTYKKLKQRSNG